jgi:hypothetical protein
MWKTLALLIVGIKFEEILLKKVYVSHMLLKKYVFFTRYKTHVTFIG